jgi:hypothetical protein
MVYTDIEELKKISRKLGRDSHFPGRDLNMVTSELSQLPR